MSPRTVRPARRGATLVLLILSGHAWTAQAQAPAPAERGIAPGASREALTLRLSVAQSQDFAGRIAAEEAPEEALWASDYSRPYSWLSGGLQYGRRGRKMTGGAYAAAQGRYDPQRQDLQSLEYFGGAGWTASLGRKVGISFHQSASRSRTYLSRLFPSVAESSVTPDLAVLVPAMYLMTPYPELASYDTTGGLDYAVTRRGTLRVGAELRYAASPGATIDALRSRAVTGGYHQALSRNATLRLDYGFRTGRYGTSTPRNAVAHDVDVGIDYRRPLSLSRRTSVSFGTGSSFVEHDEFGSDNDQAGQFQIAGHAGLHHQISRTWRADLAYRRGTGFVEGFLRPVSSDDLTASIGGRLVGRVEWSAMGSASKGDMAEYGRFLTVSGSTTVQWPFTKTLAAYASSYFTAYRPDGGGQTPAPPLPPFERYGVQAGVSFVAPLMGR